MTQKRYDADLPTVTPGVRYNLNDFTTYPSGSPVSPRYSPGAQLVTPVSSQSGGISFPCSILAFGFSFAGLIQVDATSVNLVPIPAFARFGKLYGGLLRNTGLGQGYGLTLTQLPTDRTMIELLWDGRNDDVWPGSSNLGAKGVPPAAFQSHNVNLPQPVDIGADDTLSVGLWLTPTLGQDVSLAILQASYSILYDDHQK